ncbi:MAG: YfcE family phosphodiesterase, partial [Calditrichaeota bacterium]
MKIGIISDTHGKLPGKVFHLFKDVEAILHAGDVGREDILQELETIA